ncbi:MAG: NAD(P)-dependent oxidoreductase [Geobacteraceae bacterium]|nr:NAD(P)-dependent oxidoreductase [Geobacteraceae bacterium]
MSTLLVIGGTGFFGKSILDYYKRNGLGAWGVDQVICMSRNAGRLKVEAPQLVSSGVHLYSADISETELFPSADIVIHAAASTDITRYLTHGNKEAGNIQKGTSNYCLLAPKYHNKSKILYVSSGAVYGSQPSDQPNITEESDSYSLDALPLGKREYAYGKRAAEAAIVALGQQGLSVSIARCFAFVGPWLPRDQHFAIGNFIQDGLAGRAITVKARKRVYRSYMYADDLVEWLMTIAVNAKPDCPIYNVGSDKEVLIGELAQMIAQEFGVKGEIPEITDEDVDRYVPAVDKAINELGLSLRYDLRAAMHETVVLIRKII